MKPFAPNGGFLVNDPDYAPFGCVWLRGITPARFGLIELLCLMFALRQETNEFLESNSYELMSVVFLSAHVYLATSLPMLVLVNLADRRTERSSNTRRLVTLSLSVIAGAVVYALGVMVAFGLENWPYPSIWLGIVFPFLHYFLRALLIGGLLTAVLYFFRREAAIALALQTRRLTRIALDKQMAEARLRVLQAQIEPHFLFNTLAHIKRLYLIDTAQGKAMLHNLSDYLRAALPQMRESGSTLGRELALARAYLNLLQARMGERLEVSISVPEELYGAELPPMMLSTLIENAVKHGIAPLEQGGVVTIAATRDGDRLMVSVADNGVGFQGFSGSGVGVANTRARLAALYGVDGCLAFAVNPVRGVTASINLPHSTQRGQGAGA